uniref:capsular polysaccharide export protein, LipB/KpsS family n=1 Tax=Orrella sp. TaxID=1921583 RepID=UPI004048E138
MKNKLLNFFRKKNPNDSEEKIKKIKFLNNTKINFNKYSSELNFYSGIIWAINFSKWKQPFLRMYFPYKKIRFLNIDQNPFDMEDKILRNKPLFVIWGRAIPNSFEVFASVHSVKIVYVEDGFLRSLGLGSMRFPPYSWCIDRLTTHYDMSKPSELENLIAECNLNENELSRAINCIRIFKNRNLSKYNYENIENINIDYFLDAKTKKVLVLGQVEEDQSLIYGCNTIITNLELLETACKENPDAQILYKPHPDIIAGKRNNKNDFDKILNYITVIDVSIPVSMLFEKVNKVYTITSLGGFEAIIHGLHVTTLGLPFYAGWGLTDDRLICNRRTKKKTLEELFYVAYIKYAKYKDPESGKSLEIEDVLDIFDLNLKKVNIEKLSLGKNNRLYSVNLNKMLPSRYVYNKKVVKRICIITDSSRSKEFLPYFDEITSSIDILTTRLVLANDESFLVSLPNSSKLFVDSIHSLYNSSLLNFEEKAFSISNLLSNKLLDISNEMVKNLISKDIQKEICSGLSDFIYGDVLRLVAIDDIVKNYDSIILCFENFDKNQDILHGVSYYSNLYNFESKIFVGFLEYDNFQKNKFLDIYFNNEIKLNSLVTSNENDCEITGIFSSLFWDLKFAAKNYIQISRNSIAVIGSLDPEKKIYFDSTLLLLERAFEVSKCDIDVIFINANFLNNLKFNEVVKQAGLSFANSEKLIVYHGGAFLSTKNLPNVSQERLSNLMNLISSRMNFFTSSVFAIKLANVLQIRIDLYIKKYFEYIYLLIEIESMLSNVQYLGTSMATTSFSRIIISKAKELGVNTFGIQPVMLSNSLRYKNCSNTKTMGVIDTFQGLNYKNMGYKGITIPVGSANTISALDKLDFYSSKRQKSDYIYDILFVMQHSSGFVMLEIASWLEKLASEHGFSVVVKPHPNQERVVQQRIFERLRNTNLIYFAHKASDTYELVANSNIIVGLNSNVLMEASIFGSAVIVANPSFNDSFEYLRPSFDLSVSGLCFKTNSYSDFSDLCLKIRNGAFNNNNKSNYFVNNTHWSNNPRKIALENFIDNCFGG